ncbi:hypothetical protein [Paraclostridium sordellii]|uniref:hypothetical protein n=1 Tax=Paraclostridium sordellii TaxID=1505 RepID=UPI0003862D14|nr:hypothetical protein [Paeniclostridium sordellii]AUO31635.1 hypothetical protein [Paeniclostridium sordellii]AUO31729.1 hypothetical protein [Paeniclostridium sordellii]AUO31823.1 hypothetical protein [Paeniclostridium sordellii]EPZ61105.1 hypothetical protein H476_0301 [[Clostridium] sordellii VPI 9048] [Paeniclostridium sordellii VPI 9048]CEK36618.1 hypothetical protein UMC2PCS14_00421 (plasmid) [[Clostridium] sordellii] [Paeniclostridium sordellii]
MELKIILGAISTICIGLLTNYIYDKLKSHSTSVKTKSDFELNIDFKKLKFNVKNKKSKY